MAKYLLGVNFDGGVVDTPMSEWEPEEITAHLDYLPEQQYLTTRAARLKARS